MNGERRSGRVAAGAAAAGTGAAVGAAAAAVCCVTPVVSPLIVAVLGAGGAVALAGLKPYAPYIMGGSLAALAYGFWVVYRRPVRCVVDGPRPRERRWIRLVLWVAAVIWVASAMANVVFTG
ncbi:MAG TPA: mercuric transporter MerT family protein [Gemmatimonadaceae bacterium]|nr:mercuric transporter MerT family protein [Gemmatimonadaceae bacterium]